MKSCSRKILELFYNAKHSGRIVKPEAIGRVGENDEGLVIELSWRVSNDVIMDAKFRAFGNPNAIAITSLVTDKLIGKTISEALDLSESVLLDELEELRPEYIEVFDVIKLAIENTYDNYLKKQERKANGFETTPARQMDDIDEVEVEPLVQPDVDMTEIQLQNYIENNVFGANLSNKRSRGRPRKLVETSENIEVGEKRGRGRPRKVVDESEVQVPTIKRGRGRPRKPVDESLVVEVGEKRGRGRPRKVVDETEVVETVKRGRGRPRKIVDESEIVEVGEKRGRGRPRKVVDESEVQVPAIKRRRGRPRKETSILDNSESKLNSKARIKIETLDLPPVEEEQPAEIEKEKFVDKLINNNVIVDEEFDTNYDVFKSNIRNIFSGQTADSEEQDVEEVADMDENIEGEQTAEEVVNNSEQTEIEQDDLQLQSNEQPVEFTEKRGRGRPRKIVDETEVVETVKRGRGRPRKVVDESEIVEIGEKRGRGRPRKIVEVSENVEVGEKRGRGRPRLNSVSSLTRSLTASGSVSKFNNTQDIVFASKNVTTTNINLNVSKINQTTTRIEKTPELTQTNTDTEDDVQDVEVDDFDTAEVFDDNIKDEAPAGGLADLLKALLDDDE